ELRSLGPVPDDPHREPLLPRPVETQSRAFVHDLAALAQITDHVRGFLQHREVSWFLSENAPGRIAAADAEVHAAARELLADREDARCDGRFARRRVRHRRPPPHALSVLRAQREEPFALL